ncbi:group 1 glycosyl transferase [Fictibacillus macauensis ZFHKF-1]|uniref:Group 1 glycosyl transferase n=1 Tax=Fictibacillus macauensis ZFHKF-1 TaxID=1196324 RepID=I8AGU0_9BACL|nr:glycosyltransferase [Fictibacillus macauensis]EIT84629.1 group 1 glycosyl transferase [Fictibacillus macauensis ZFHKF-1]
MRKPGVHLIGYSRAEQGTGQSCRLAAHALEAADVPLAMVHYWPIAARQEDHSWVHKEVTEPCYNTNIFHINADQLDIAYRFRLLDRKWFRDAYNIAVWHWELPQFPEEFQESFSLVDEIWAPSRFIQNAIAKNTTKPVHWMPHCTPPLSCSAKSRQAFTLPQQSFLFLMMYDPNSSLIRKNPQGAIKAFQRAFAPNDSNVALVIKINSNTLNLEEELAHLQRLIADYQNIIVINQTLSREDMNALIKCVDCFVSLHRSEGFGLSIAEAMKAGKLAIATGWSGNLDFMNKENACLVSAPLISVGEDWGPYKAHQQWGDPDLEEAAAYMKKATKDSAWKTTKEQKALQTIEEQFSPKVCGERMKKRLQQLTLLPKDEQSF